MKLFKRVFISVTRTKGKSILLFLLAAGLGTLVSGAIVLNQSIHQTRDNLWRSLPPVVVVDMDWEAQGRRIPLTVDVMKPIMELPYVRSFDIFEGTAIYSRELERVLLDFPIESDQLSLEGYPVVMMELRGITNSNVMDIELGIHELALGRTFTQAEMQSVNPRNSVAMISYQLAALNDLEIGSIITMENNLYKYHLIGSEHYWGHNPDEHIVASETYTLEIIGMFDPVIVPDFASNMQEVHANNGILVPLSVVHSVLDFRLKHSYEDAISRDLNVNLQTAASFSHRNIILLHDAADLPAFISAAEELLPNGYKIGTFSNSVLAVERFDHSMDFFQNLSVQILWITPLAMIISLGLLMLLFLRDRKSEMGIYLALGEKKINIVKQLLIEVLIPSIAGIMLALFLGNMAANYMGHEMLVNELISGQDFNLDDYGWSTAGAQLQWFMDDQIETVIENYELTLEGRTIALFWSISLTAIFMSTVIPIVYMMKRPTKEILLQQE